MPAAAESTTSCERAWRISSPSAARLQPELCRQVDGPEHERSDPGQARGLVGEAQALRRLDDRDHRRAGVAERLDGVGRRLGQHDPGERQIADGHAVVVEELGIGAVDADRLQGRALHLAEQARGELACRRLLGWRHRVLEVRGHGVCP